MTAMATLSPASLDALPEDIARPAYDREAVGVSIVHLGLGAFHRAHMAVYVDDLLAQMAGRLGDLRRQPAQPRASAMRWHRRTGFTRLSSGVRARRATASSDR